MLFTFAQDAAASWILQEKMSQNSKVFDIIVLAGMVVNLILAVFLILYYFDFL